MAKPYLRNGVWYSNFRAGGQRVRKALSPNKRTAQAMLDDMVAVFRAQKNGIAPRHVSWSLFEGKYMEFCQANKKHNTVIRDKRAFDQMKAALPIIQLADVTPEKLERLKFLWKDKLTPAVVTRNIKSIKTAMRRAEEWKYIAPQNWRSVHVEEPKGRLIYWTVPELERLIETAHGIARTVVIIMARSGLRSGEVYHLEWEDIRFDLHKIHIIWKPCTRGCLGCESGKWMPKGKKERWVPLDASLEHYLQALPHAPGWLLGAKAPSFVYILREIKQAIRIARLKGSPHTLRHTFASHAISNGASLAAIGAILGHSSLATTQIYAHLMPHAQEDAIARLPVVRLGHNNTAS